METTHPLHPTDLLPGSLVGPWRLLSLLSRDSSGLIFHAERADRPEANPGALKIALEPEDPRFVLEKEVLSRLHHPSVPLLYDSGQWSGPCGALFPFVVMDCVGGMPLYSWARFQPRASPHKLRVLSRAASAIQAVHEAGALHRDIKGASFLVRPSDGHVWLMGFGSCTYRGAPIFSFQTPPPGTPPYLSPQYLHHQWKFRRRRSARYEFSPADDVYSLGVTAYHLATGRYPLIIDDLTLEQDPDYYRFPEMMPADKLVPLSPDLGRWIQQMLTRDPRSRGTAKELALGMAMSADREEQEAEQTPPSEQQPPRDPARQPIPWRQGFGPALAGFALLIGGMVLGHALRDPSLLASPWSQAQAARAAAQELGTSSVGEAALQEPLAAAETPPANESISADVPKEPLPNQRRPPCKKPQVEINGGCWIPVADEAPPCIQSTYEWRRQCYFPVSHPSRPSTSGQK